jgi:hypothetical protein
MMGNTGLSIKEGNKNNHKYDQYRSYTKQDDPTEPISLILMKKNIDTKDHPAVQKLSTALTRKDVMSCPRYIQNNE